MGRFVEITVAGQELDPESRRRIARACPVDIFRVDDAGALATHPEREDECILCGRCVAIAPQAVEVRRAYGARQPVAAAAGGDDA